MSSATFSQTRNSAITLENQTQALLGRFSKIQQANSVEASPEELSLTDQISNMLQKRENTVATLRRAAESDESISTSKLQQLQRHKEILAADRSSFLKIQSRINDERNKNNLLFLVQSDISAHKQRNVSSVAAEDASDYILDEGRRVNAANSFADRLLQQAYETRDELISQRAYLQNAQSRILSTILTIPGINVLVSRINTRRKRDTLIMASVITFCILGLFFLS